MILPNKEHFHSFIVVYDEMTFESIPSGFGRLDNRLPERKEIYEIEPIIKFLTSVSIDDSHFYGFFSPKVFEKTGLSPDDLKSMESSDFGSADIVSISPFVIVNHGLSNPIHQAELAHGDFSWRFQYFINELDKGGVFKLAEYCTNFVPTCYFMFSHYFWARGKFWKEWAGYVEKALALEKANRCFREVINDECRYIGSGGNYKYIVFLLERLAGLMAYSKGLCVTEGCLKQRWIYEFDKRKGENRIFLNIARTVYLCEFFLRGDRHYPVISHFLASNMAKVWRVFDRFVEKVFAISSSG